MKLPTLKRAPNIQELQELEKIFLQAETEIINEIGRLRSLGLVDYHAVAALERVQKILTAMKAQSGKYVPQMVEKMFYVRVPEARKILEPAEKHLVGYTNAAQLTGTQQTVVRLLVDNLTGEIEQAAATAMTKLTEALLGRQEADIFRTVGLEAAARMQAVGRSAARTIPDFVNRLRQEGVTAFVDKAGRNWNLHTYANMVCRTTSRQAEVAAVLTADEEQDLYQISKHGTTCALCAPYEGRVYSKSGTDPDFPPLADAFGKIDPLGGNILTNTWLNIHPNCLHVLVPWTAAGRTEKEIKEIKRFSNPATNPYSVDPRSQAQIEAYRKKELARRHYLNDRRQWERYQETLGDKAPKTFETFQKHKQAGDEKYKSWEKQYREQKALEKYHQVRYHEDGTIVVTDTWTAHRSIPSTYKPNAVVETRFPGRQVDRTFYDEKGKMVLQVHSGDHGYPKKHPYGSHGEHAHDFIYDAEGKIMDRIERELTGAERKENGDIL